MVESVPFAFRVGGGPGVEGATARDLNELVLGFMGYEPGVKSIRP